jgi:hypothetical protein
VSGIKGTKSSAALIVAVVALVAALGGGAVAGVTISKLNNKEKEQVKRIAERKAKRLDKKIELLPGPQGERGPQGEPGEDATNLFGFIQALGGGPKLQYGSGVNAVSEVETGEYRVDFDRDLTGCVAQVTTGVGEPKENLFGADLAYGRAWIGFFGDNSEVRVNLRRPNGTTNFGVPVSTSFFITAFC